MPDLHVDAGPHESIVTDEDHRLGFTLVGTMDEQAHKIVRVADGGRISIVATGSGLPLGMMLKRMGADVTVYRRQTVSL